MTPAHGIALTSSLAALAALVLAAPASAQDACSQAAAHATDCQTQFCPLAASPDRCNESLQALADELGTACDAETAQGFLLQSCAGLVGSAAGGGTICEQAVAHFLDCVDQVCSVANPPETCQYFDGVEEEIEAELEDRGCPPEMQPEMERVLTAPCDTLIF